MIVNWHEGNIPSLAIAAESLHRDHGMSVLTVQACYVAEELYGHSCNGLTHGGEIEALAVLAHRPDLVHLDRIDYSSDHAHGHKMDKLRRTRSLPAGAHRHPLDRADRLVRQPAARHRREGRKDARRHRRRHRQRGARTSSRSSTRCKAAPPRSTRIAAGEVNGTTAEAIGSEALGLPGRTSLEPVSGEIGSRVTFRIAEIAGGSRATHRAARTCTTASRNASTCCKGTGVTHSESGEIPIKPGDIVLIPPNEKHMTVNTGSEPLVLLCFFPEPDVTSKTEEFKSF